jgi:RimJ/RimL family protein N-acetyltransferase
MMIAATDRMDRFWAGELGCLPEALDHSGVTLCAPALRAGPRWMGWIIPFTCLALDRVTPGAGIISITPTYYHDLKRALGDGALHLLSSDSSGLRPFARVHFPQGTTRVDRVLQCAVDDFRPAPTIFPIQQLPENDPQMGWFRMHFDGPIFVARDDYGSIAAWAAIKCKSDDVWEMAVVTEARYRNRGLARSVVGQATTLTFDAGKTPLYLHDITNSASAKVCASLGYQHYGHYFSCECGRVTPRR